MTLRYEDPSVSRNEAIRLLAEGDESDIVGALVSIGLNESDREWAENTCLEQLVSGNEAIASSAITALGHIARRHGELKLEKVHIALELAKKRFPSLEGVIADAIEDIELFT